MGTPKPSDTDRLRSLPGPVDEVLGALVDAIVQAVDANRDYEIDRLRAALEPFGADSMFAAEMRLNARCGVDEWCICGGGLF